MSGPFPFDVEVGRVRAVDVLHYLGKVALRRFQQQMIMVAHQAVCMNNCAVSLRGGFQVREEFFTILPTFEYILLFIPPRSYMVKCAGVFDS
jgi:hypothetical protein